MNNVDHSQQNNTESPTLEDKQKTKRVGAHQQQDLAINQTSDIQQVLVVKEEVPQVWIPTLDQQNPEPLHSNEGQEKLSTGPEGEEINELEETEFPFAVVTVKGETDEESQSSPLQQNQTEDDTEAETPTTSPVKWIKLESDEEDCEEQDRNSDSEPNNGEKASDSFETEKRDGDDDNWKEPMSATGSDKEDGDWKEGRARKSGVKRNVGHKTSKKSFSCSECGKQFLYKQSLQKHMTLHPGRTFTSCLGDKKDLGGRQNLDSPTKVGEKRFDCDSCGKTFKYHSHLQSHMRVHSEEKHFGCDECGKTFRYLGNLKSHMRVHSGEKLFQCDVCGKRFKQRTHFKIHMIVHTEDKSFSCDECGKKFKYQSSLKAHMSDHSGEKPFQCIVCSKRFSQQGVLTAHVAVHSGEKPFACISCGKRFRLKSDLKVHMRSHSGVKPFSCEDCGVRFSRQGSLLRHNRLHTGERQFGCDECDKTFTRKTHLMAHMTSHTGEKRFDCDICGARFSQKGSLKRHHMRVHMK